MDEGECSYYFGEALVVFEEADDEVGGHVERPGGDEVDGQGRWGFGEERGACFDRPGIFRLRKETSMQPEIRVNLSTGRTGSGEYISGVEGSRTPEPVVWCGCGKYFHDSGAIEYRGRGRVTTGDHSEDDL